jgi:hypothetical protein
MCRVVLSYRGYTRKVLFFRMHPRGFEVGSLNGDLPIPMWGCDLCSNGHGRHTTRIAIVLAFWQISDNVILIMFGTS